MYSVEEINEFIMELRRNGISVKGISDGYHTFGDYRARNSHLMIALCRSNPDIAWKTKKHFDNENDPMFDGDFLAGINAPGGVISYHLKMKYWDLLNIPEIELGPKYDGYTDEDVNKRLLTIGNLPFSSEIDSAYVDKLFEYVSTHSTTLSISLYADNDEEEDFHDPTVGEALQNNLPNFLNVIISYADKNGIYECQGPDSDYSEAQYYYYVRYKDITLKLGLMYEGDIVYITEEDPDEDDDVINCEDVLKELSIQTAAQENNDSKKLSLKPSNKKKKEEEN